MKLFFFAVTLFAGFVCAEESILKSKVVFDYNGQRQVATVGSKPIVTGDQRIVAASWLEEVKNGTKSSRTQKIDLNSSTVALEVPSQKLNLNGKSVEVKTGDMVLGKDKNVYEVAGVFANGEVAFRLVDNKYGKLRTQYNTLVKGSEFIASVEVPCIGPICKEALVRRSNPAVLCGVQKVGYYKENGIKESQVSTQECNRMKKGAEGDVVLMLFQDNTVITGYQPPRKLYPETVVEDTPVAIEQ